MNCQTYDDVIRTVKSTDDPKKYREALLLDQHKSTQSLANIYEQEYNKHNQVESVCCKLLELIIVFGD
jgi:U3 small nucleolar RNA-associated protein MPP10